MAPTGPSESRTHSPAANPPAANPAAAVLPGMDPPGWRWRWPADVPDPNRPKSCLKSAGPTRQGLSVRFADNARCLVSEAPAPPHPTSRDEWMKALARARFVQEFMNGRTREEIMDDIDGIDPRRVEQTRWCCVRRVRWILDSGDIDPWDLEAYAFRLLFRRSRKHMVRNMVGCPIRNRRDRANHPALGGPDTDPALEPEPDPPRTCSQDGQTPTQRPTEPTPSSPRPGASPLPPHRKPNSGAFALPGQYTGFRTCVCVNTPARDDRYSTSHSQRGSYRVPVPLFSILIAGAFVEVVYFSGNLQKHSKNPENYIINLSRL
ncbi:hypothetical protein B0I37DRAFT_354250 [Chaetomium sp. MPI-CAGE-AT-0009]|nr:hypothetical protein B0I37DRAFT_354250 [Chaetomium sp. MPI-CAGE-AT-0009]